MIYSATLQGVEPVLVEIEIDLSPGLPFFQIVGLPDEVLRESKTRVKSSIQQAGYDFPYESRLVLNLAPSRLKKEGSAFELALAAQILFTSGQVTMPQKNILFLGELALDGSVRGTPEVAALALVAELEGKIDFLVVPFQEASKFSHLFQKPIVELQHINQLKEALWWEKTFLRQSKKIVVSRDKEEMPLGALALTEVSEFWAEHLKIAAIGHHHYFLVGSQGCGKTFFAEAVRGLRQNFDVQKEMKLQILNSIFDRSENEMPWSAPHHSASIAGLVGGGIPPRPGAVTRAHGGILFLDELLEFSPASLDALREPLEKGWVEVARAGQSLKFPSRFQLIAAANPCRCGWWGHPLLPCSCSTASRLRYRMKVSGPLLDRFDLVVHCPPLLGGEKKVTGMEIINHCREAWLFRKSNGLEDLKLTGGGQDLVHCYSGRNIKSHRQNLKWRRLSQTLAVLDFSHLVSEKHLKKAFELMASNPFEDQGGQSFFAKRANLLGK